MDAQRMLFTNKEEIQWKAEAKRRMCNVRSELLADGTYFVAFVKDGKHENICGLFKRGDDGGGYFARPVNRVNSAKMILKSYKHDIAELNRTTSIIDKLI